MTGNGHSASFTYDGWNPIIEFDQAGNWKAMNLYGFGADEILGRYDATLGHLIYKQDKQGNVTFVLNPSNQIVEKYTYDAYGTPKIFSTNNTQLSTSAIGNRFMYTGREWIGELGIYDYRHRYHHPALGRFLQTDPTGFDGGDMNLFRYCDDDPVDGTDPTGLFNMWGNLEKFFNGNPSMNVVRDAWNAQRSSGLTMANVRVEKAGENRPLMPLPPDVLSRMHANQQENAKQANDPKNWTPVPGTTKAQKEEYATGLYRKGKGLAQDGPNKGYHVNGEPRSEIFRPEYKGGGTRAVGTHIHVTGNGRHLLFDRDQAIRYHFISGTGHISSPTRMEIFRPYESGGGGKYFYTTDGVNLRDGRLPW